MGNSVETVPLAPASEDRSPAGSGAPVPPNFGRSPLLGGALLLLLIAWLYHSILYHLALQWIRDPNFQLGMFVPAFSLYVLWLERDNLKRIAPSSSWVGLPLVVLAMLMLVLGVLGVELFTSRFSLVVLIAGLILLLHGRALFRAVLFPWAFLVLMIPLPGLILQQVTFPLQMLAAKLATFLLQTAGVPALREGNVILLPYMALEVVEACSGIRSLFSLVTLAIIYGYLLEKRIWVRITLAVSAVPIAVVANGLRIFGTGIVGKWDPAKAEGFFHEFQGWLVFVVSLILLFTLHSLINLIWKPAPDSHSDSSSLPALYPQDRKLQRGPNPSPALLSILSARFLIPALLMFATAAGLQAYSRKGDVVLTRQPLSSLPTQIDGWTGTDDTLDDPTLELLGHPEYVLRNYVEASLQQPDIGVFIAYYPSQASGDTIHSPAHCLPGAGWVPTSRKIIYLTGADGTKFPANRFVISKAGERELAIYWFQAHGRGVANEYMAKYYLIADSIRMHRSDGGLVRFITPMYPGESADAAQARVMAFGNHILPLLNDYIPR
ncbi:MAG: VPLPA-CTERM-specific exosortase XrtD [Terriglobales bacterium]|jgi:exosortase D (VPLPA-CTERM-specific)